MNDRSEYHKKYYAKKRDFLKAIRIKNATITKNMILGTISKRNFNTSLVFDFIQQTNNVNK